MSVPRRSDAAPVPSPAERTAIACWLTMLLVLGFGATLVCRVPDCGATAFDHTIMRLAHDWRSDLLDRTFTLLTWGGSLFVLVPAALCIVLWLTVRGRYAAAWFFAAALAGGSALSQLGKLIVARPRPELFDAVTAMPADHAYPSAHSVQITAFAVALYLLLRQRDGLVRPWLAAILLAALLLISASRVYLQVHFPSDVVAGIVTSALWVAGLAALLLRQRGE